MKKTFKILGICITAILAVVLILPFTLKGKIADIVRTEGNKMLNAKFDFQSLNMSLIRNFPSATISMEDFWLKGNDEFENDTLIKAKELSATINVMSLFSKSGYEISQILIDDTDIHAIILKNGKTNWDIMKASPDDTGDTDASEESTAFRVKLENLAIDGLSLRYDDQQTNMKAQIDELQMDCSGDFGTSQTLLQLNAETPRFTYIVNEIPLLNQVKLKTKMDIDADFLSKTFTLKDNMIKINAVRATLNGWMKQIDKGYEMDIQLNSDEIGLKDILSLIPAMYTKDFNELTADGKVELKAFAKGIYQDSTRVPNFNLALQVRDGRFHYPSMPGSVNGINIALSVNNPGNTLDATTIQVSPFNFVMAGNSFGITAMIKNPISDFNFDVTAQGKLDFGKLKDVYPMQDMSLNGKIDADMNLSGRQSYIEKEQYEKIRAEGSLTLKDMNLELNNLPTINVKQATLSFSPQYLKLNETTIDIGKNNLTIKSQFKNYLAYAFQGKTLQGSLNVSSTYLNLNDFMTNEPVSNEQVNNKDSKSDRDIQTDKDNNTGKRTQPSNDSKQTGLHIPKDIDFRLETNLKLVLLDKMKFENINGLLIIKDQKMDMSNLSLNSMGGKIVANSIYATPKHQQATLTGSFALEKLNFAETYTELDMIKQLAPIFAGLKGSYSGNVKIDAKLNEKLDVDLSNVQGSGNLSTHDLSLSNVKFIDQIATIIKKPSLKDIKVKNLSLDFSIDDGRVTTQPFELRLGDYSINLSGSTGLDQSIDYKGKITLPTSLTSRKEGTSAVDMNIRGTFSEPKVSIDMTSLAKVIAQQALGTSHKDKGDNQEKGKNIFDKAKDLFKKKAK